MIGIFPCAGDGERVAHLTGDTPKALYPFGGKPMLAHAIELYDTMLDRIVVVVREEQLEHFRSFCSNCTYKEKMRLVVQQELNGMGGAVLAALTSMHGVVSGGCLVVAPDTYSGSMRIPARGHSISMRQLGKSDTPRSAVWVCSTSLVVREIREYDPLDLSFLPVSYEWGGTFYTIDARMLGEVLTGMNERKEYVAGELPMTSAIQLMIEAGYTVMGRDVYPCIDMGTPEGFAALTEYFRERGVGK